jgi:hypothetical protein
MKTIKLSVPKVSNMVSNSGNDIANQFEITGKDFFAFQSYRSIIVVHKNGKTYLDHNKWDYSVTTGKYRNRFLGENKAETQRKIDAGIYELAELNS